MLHQQTQKQHLFNSLFNSPLIIEISGHSFYIQYAISSTLSTCVSSFHSSLTRCILPLLRFFLFFALFCGYGSVYFCSCVLNISFRCIIVIICYRGRKLPSMNKHPTESHRLPIDKQPSLTQ